MSKTKPKAPVDPKVIRDNRLRGYLARAERDQKTARFAHRMLDFDGADHRYKRADAEIQAALALDPTKESPAWQEFSLLE